MNQKILAISSGSLLVLGIILYLFFTSNEHRFRRAVLLHNNGGFMGAIEILNMTSDQYQDQHKIKQLRSSCLYEMALDASASGAHDAVLENISGITPDFSDYDEVLKLATSTSFAIFMQNLEIKNREKENKRLEKERLETERKKKEELLGF